MTEGALTTEELALLPERAREWYWLAAVSLQARAQECVLYLCYELAQAKLEIKRLELEALRDESQS